MVDKKNIETKSNKLKVKSVRVKNTKKETIDLDPNSKLLMLMEYLLNKFDYNTCYSEEGIRITGEGVLAIGIVKPVLENLESVDNFIKKAITSEACNSKRFVLIHLLLSTKVGVLIVDTFKKTAEHFEPYGSLKDKGYNTACALLESVVKSRGLQYLKPETVCPSFGPKSLNSYCENSAEQDSCYLWSIWYSELRLQYPHTLSQDLLSKVKDNIGLKFCNFIRGYSQFITEFSKKHRLITKNFEGVKVTVSYKLKETIGTPSIAKSIPKVSVAKLPPKLIFAKVAVGPKELKKKKPLLKNRLFIQLEKQKPNVVQLSMGKKSLATYKKNNFEWKKNILRNRPIEYVLKNLNSNKKLSFYKL